MNVETLKCRTCSQSFRAVRQSQGRKRLYCSLACKPWRAKPGSCDMCGENFKRHGGGRLCVKCNRKRRAEANREAYRNSAKYQTGESRQCTLCGDGFICSHGMQRKCTKCRGKTKLCMCGRAMASGAKARCAECYLADARTHPENLCRCGCGERFVVKHVVGRRGHTGEYLDSVHYWSMRKRVRAEIESLRRIAQNWKVRMRRCCDCCVSVIAGVRCQECRRKHARVVGRAKYHANPRAKLDRQRELKGLPPVSFICPDCGRHSQSANRRCLTCQNMRSKAWKRAYAKKSCARRRSRMRAGRYQTIDPMKVFERDGWQCQLCKCETSVAVPVCDDNRANLDHVVPLARGGTHTWDNVRCLCRVCNILKGAWLDEEMVIMESLKTMAWCRDQFLNDPDESVRGIGHVIHKKMLEVAA